MNRSRALGLGLAATAALAYGSGPIFAKRLYAAGFEWPEVLVWRFGIAATLSWALVLVRPSARAGIARLRRRTALALLGTGSLASGSSSTFYAAVQLVPVSLAAVLQLTYPAIVAVLTTRVGHLARGPRPWIALAVAISGAALTVGGVGTGRMPAGIVLAAASGLIYALYCVVGARIAGERKGVIAVERSGQVGPDTDSAVAAAVMLTGTWAVMVALAAMAGRPVAPWDVPVAGWPGLLGIGFFAALAVQAFYAASARIGVAQAALISILDPVSQVALAALILGERLGPIQALGALMVFAGVLIALYEEQPAVKTIG